MYFAFFVNKRKKRAIFRKRIGENKKKINLNSSLKVPCLFLLHFLLYPAQVKVRIATSDLYPSSYLDWSVPCDPKRNIISPTIT